MGRCCSRFGATSSRRATASAPTTPVSCVLRARRLGDRRARRAAADRESLEEARRQIGRPEPHHLLVRIHARAAFAPHRRATGRSCPRTTPSRPRNPPISTGTMSAHGYPGDCELGQALRQRAQHRHAGSCRRGRRAPTIDGRADHGDQDPGKALAALEEQDHRERAGTDRERRPVGACRRGSARAMLHRLRSGPSLSIEKPEQLGQLADQHRQRDPVHVAVADRLRQKLGDEAEPRKPARTHTAPETIAIMLASATARCGSPPDSGSTTAEDDGGQRRVRPEHQDPARPEQRVGQQRDDRRVEPVDAGHARRHRIGDADRHQHRRQHEARRRCRAAARRDRSEAACASPGSQRARVADATGETPSVQVRHGMHRAQLRLGTLRPVLRLRDLGQVRLDLPE